MTGPEVRRAEEAVAEAPASGAAGREEVSDPCEVAGHRGGERPMRAITALASTIA